MKARRGRAFFISGFFGVCVSRGRAGRAAGFVSGGRSGISGAGQVPACGLAEQGRVIRGRRPERFRRKNRDDGLAQQGGKWTLGVRLGRHAGPADPRKKPEAEGNAENVVFHDRTFREAKAWRRPPRVTPAAPPVSRERLLASVYTRRGRPAIQSCVSARCRRFTISGSRRDRGKREEAVMSDNPAPVIRTKRALDSASSLAYPVPPWEGV